MQANFSARPENGVTNAIGKINFAGFGGAHQTGIAEIEASVMPANYIVAQRRIAEIVGILHASGNHRVGIDSWDPARETSRAWRTAPPSNARFFRTFPRIQKEPGKTWEACKVGKEK